MKDMTRFRLQILLALLGGPAVAQHIAGVSLTPLFSIILQTSRNLYTGSRKWEK